MSSVRMSVSGQRSLTTTLNDPALTSAQMPTKADDKAILTVGNATEIRFLLPANAKLDLVASKKNGAIGPNRYLRVTVPGPGASLSVFVDAPQSDEEGRIIEATGSWPHFNIDLGKHLRDYFAGDETLAVIETLHERVGDDLIPATEEA